MQRYASAIKYFVGLLAMAALVLGWGSAGYYGNQNTSLLFTGLGLAANVIYGIVLGFWLRRDQSPSSSPPPTLADVSYVLPAVFAPFFLSVLAAAFVYPTDIEGKIWVINGRVGEPDQTVLAIPFLQEIRGFTAQPLISTTATATTKDGKHVQGRLSARMRLSLDETVLEQVVRGMTDADEVIQQQLKDELVSRWEETVAQYNLAELGNSLVLEWETGSRVSKPLLTSLRVSWAGTLKIDEVHAYLAEADGS